MAETRSDEIGIIAESRERFERAWRHERDEREQQKEDLKFRVGEQWPEKIEQDRTTEGRPTLTINRLPQFVRQITGDIRLNRPSIKVKPADDGADIETAKTFAGMTRHIEHASKAQNAYITAAESAANCGIGHFRITTEYPDDGNFEQDIRIKRVINPFSVYWDPGAEEQTKSDANWCFITERMQIEEFEKKYPDKRATDFEGDELYADADLELRWGDDKSVRIAEYWVVEKEVHTLALMTDGESVDITDLSKKDMPPDDMIVRKRDFTVNKVMWYKLSGSEILEGPSPWAGKFIPIVPVVGEEVHIGERLVRHGIIRYAKDPQQLYNYSRTMAAETIALAPKAPWVMTPAMVEGHKAQWDSANTGNPAYLLANPDPQVPGLMPQRTVPAPPPAALFAEANVAVEDMSGVTGIYPSSLGQRSNESSGKAILARERQGDVGTFVYADNLATAISYAGEIMVDLIPKIYDTARIVRILGEDETEDFVEINTPKVDEKTGLPVLDENKNPILDHDISVGKYDVSVTTGPSFTTRRQEAAEQILEFVKAFPGAGPLIMDMIPKNMDWADADALAERLKKGLPPGIAESNDDPTEQEQQAMQQAQQQAEQQQQIEQQAIELQMAGAQAELAKTQAEIAKNEAEIAKNETAMLKTMAEADKIEAETDGQHLQNVMSALEMSLVDGDLATMLRGIIQDELAATQETNSATQDPNSGPFSPQQPIGAE